MFVVLVPTCGTRQGIRWGISEAVFDEVVREQVIVVVSGERKLRIAVGPPYAVVGPIGERV